MPSTSDWLENCLEIFQSIAKRGCSTTENQSGTTYIHSLKTVLKVRCARHHQRSVLQINTRSRLYCAFFFSCLTGPRPDKNFACVDNNTIFDNAGHGIYFSGSEGLLIRGNNVHNNEGCGIKIAKPAEITIEDNSVCRNNSSGVSIEIACSANVSGNGIYGNRKHGIVVSGKGLIKENDVFCNALSGVELRGPGDPYITRNRIQSTDHYGVNILENARGYVDSNDIYQCSAAGLYQHPDSTVLVINNRTIPVNTKNGRQVRIVNEGTNDCRHDPVGLDLDSPPRPLLPDKNSKFPRPAMSRISMSSSGNGHLVAGMASCNGRSRFCVVS